MNYINDATGIKMWNNGQYLGIHASGILLRIENKKTSPDSVALTPSQVEGLKTDDEFTKDRMRDKHSNR